MKRIIFILLGVLVGFAICAPLSFASAGSTNIDAKSIVELTNEYRQKNNLSPLLENVKLDRAATLKAQDMAKKSYFSHVSPDGKSPWYWFKVSGYSFDHAGENLAVSFNNSKDVVDAWMNSASHKKNILNQEFIEEGVGVANGMYMGKKTIYVVQVYGQKA